MAQVVSINRVIPVKSEPSQYFIVKMMEVLKRQGQIEPLQVRSNYGDYIVHDENSHGDDIVYAARALGWDTLLILSTPNYIE